MIHVHDVITSTFSATAASPLGSLQSHPLLLDQGPSGAVPQTFLRPPRALSGPTGFFPSTFSPPSGFPPLLTQLLVLGPPFPLMGERGAFPKNYTSFQLPTLCTCPAATIATSTGLTGLSPSAEDYLSDVLVVDDYEDAMDVSHSTLWDSVSQVGVSHILLTPLLRNTPSVKVYHRIS